MEIESERERGRDRERERERVRERGESKREGELPYVMIVFSPQTITIFSVISFLNISEKKFRIHFLNVGRPIIRAF